MQTKILWINHFWKALVFFLFSIFVLSCFRLFFLFYFSDGFSEFGIKDIFPALWTGLRVDAKWLSLSLAPAFLLLLISYWKPFLFKYSSVFAIIGLFGMVALDAINFGFFSFYKTPISPLIFGFVQDDTEAILKTLWSDWPIATYLIVIIAGTAFPTLIGSLINIRKSEPKGVVIFMLGLLATLVLSFFIRGSLTKFPLRQEDFAVSKIQLINASVPNGAAALYEATKAWRNFQIKGAPEQALHNFGYTSVEEAKKDLVNRDNTLTSTSSVFLLPTQR